jgi:NitT/TauT family transport system substrate-binding protein
LPEADLHTFRDVGAVLAIHDWLRERPDVIAAYLKSEEEARDMLTNAPDLAAYYIWTDISEIPPAVVRATIDMMVWDGRLGANMIQHLKACARMWKKQGLYSGERSQDPDKYVDEWANGKFLDLAMKEMEAEGHWTSNKLPGFPKESRPEQLQRQSWKTHENFKPMEKIWKRTKI